MMFRRDTKDKSRTHAATAPPSIVCAPDDMQKSHCRLIKKQILPVLDDKRLDDLSNAIRQEQYARRRCITNKPKSKSKWLKKAYDTNAYATVDTQISHLCLVKGQVLPALDDAHLEQLELWVRMEQTGRLCMHLEAQQQVPQAIQKKVSWFKMANK